MITVATCSNLAEAELLKSVLEAHGIVAVIPNAHTPQPLSGFPSGYRLQVAAEEENRARDLLDQIKGAPPASEFAQPSTPNPPGTGLFQAAIFADMLLSGAFWLHSMRGGTRHPPQIEEYLTSLAPSLAGWQVGYLGYQALSAISFIGGLLMLFRVRTGWTLYTLSALLFVSFLWVFPAGIGFGVWSALGALQLLIVGGIITFGFIHRNKIFGYATSQ